MDIWIKVDSQTIKCPECGAKTDKVIFIDDGNPDMKTPKYCPNCGHRNESSK